MRVGRDFFLYSRKRGLFMRVGRRDRAGGGGGGGGGGGVSNNGRGRRDRADLVPTGWLSFEFFPLCGYSFFGFPSNRFHLFGIYRIFVSIMGS